jgi:hypothetical protein
MPFVLAMSRSYTLEREPGGARVRAEQTAPASPLL